MQSSGGNIVSYGKAHKRGQLKEAVLFSCISSPTEASSKGAALPVRRTLLAWIAWMALYTPTAPWGQPAFGKPIHPAPLLLPAFCCSLPHGSSGQIEMTPPGLWVSAPLHASPKACFQASGAGSVAWRRMESLWDQRIIVVSLHSLCICTAKVKKQV